MRPKHRDLVRASADAMAALDANPMALYYQAMALLRYDGFLISDNDRATLRRLVGDL